MARNKLVDNLIIPFTAEEEKAWDAAEQRRREGAFDRTIADLRSKRNQLLTDSDWWASSDLVMSDERKAYRQALRDLPSGLDTEEKVKNVTWPTKPE